jgi:hypothetical protein
MLKRLGRSWTVRLGVSAAVVASALGMSALPTSATTVKRPLAVVAKSFRFLGVPRWLPAGQYDVRFLNISPDDHEFVAVNLGPVCSRTVTSVAQAVAVLNSQDPDVVCPGNSFEGAAFAGPGGRDREAFTFTPGRTLYFCGVPENGVPHYDLGMIGFINVFAVPTGR